MVTINGYSGRLTVGERCAEILPFLGGVYAPVWTPYLGVDCVRTRWLEFDQVSRSTKFGF